MVWCWESFHRPASQKGDLRGNPHLWKKHSLQSGVCTKLEVTSLIWSASLSAVVPESLPNCILIFPSYILHPHIVFLIFLLGCIATVFFHAEPSPVLYIYGCPQNIIKTGQMPSVISELGPLAPGRKSGIQLSWLHFQSCHGSVLTSSLLNGSLETLQRLLLVFFFSSFQGAPWGAESQKSWCNNFSCSND